MKNVIIIFSFLFLLPNLIFAQQNDNQVVLEDHYSNKDSMSIMSQNRLQRKSYSDWQNGMEYQKRKIVKKNTIAYTIIGATIGGGIPFMKQLGGNMVVSMLFDHPVEDYAFNGKPIVKGLLIGALAGAGVGFTIGKRRAERKEREWMGKVKFN